MNAKQNLESILIPFYSRLEDKMYGGFFGRVDSELNIYKRSSKGMVQSARLLWFFSTVGEALDRPDLRRYADNAYFFIVDHGIDDKNGGLYWSVSYSGLETEDETKNAVCQATGILAFSAYGTEESLNRALSLFDLLENKFFSGYLYREAWNEDYSHCIIKNSLVTSLLHIIESYTLLYQKTGQERIKRALERNLSILHDKFYDKEKMLLYEIKGGEGEVILTEHLFGHGLECVQLVAKACEVLGESVPEWIMSLLDSSIDKGFVDGHMAYSEGKTEGVHWVQAHAVRTLSFVERTMGITKYQEKKNEIICYIDDHFVMKKANSEWFHDDSGLSRDVVSIWKGPYDNSSMYLELLEAEDGLSV